MAKRRANGEGSIRKRNDGRWEGRYTVGYDPETGKRIIKNVLGKTQAEVKGKLKAAVKQAQQVDMIRTDDYTVATWLWTWYELYSKPNVRPSTAEYYRRSIEQHVVPRIGDIKLNRLASRDIQKLYRDLQENGRLREVQRSKNPGLSNATVRGIHMVLHNALDRAVKERLILRNPTEDCIIPKLVKQEMKILHPEDMSSYLQAADNRGVLPLFYLELVSGLRKGEHEKHPDNPYMFPLPKTGGMYYPDSIVNLHKKILKDAGLEHIRFHDLRHTFATMALQNGVDVKTVSTMLGHYDAGFTLRTYTHATRQKQDEAARTMGSVMTQIM